MCPDFLATIWGSGSFVSAISCSPLLCWSSRAERGISQNVDDPTDQNRPFRIGSRGRGTSQSYPRHAKFREKSYIECMAHLFKKIADFRFRTRDLRSAIY